MVLTSPLQSNRLAEIMGVSKSSITRIRNGQSYMDVRPDLKRPGRSKKPHKASRILGANCKFCELWTNECSIGIPESKKSTEFAALCNSYIMSAT